MEIWLVFALCISFQFHRYFNDNKINVGRLTSSSSKKSQLKMMRVHIHCRFTTFYLNKYLEMYHFITENRLNVCCYATWLRFVGMCVRKKTIFQRKTFKKSKEMENVHNNVERSNLNCSAENALVRNASFFFSSRRSIATLHTEFTFAKPPSNRIPSMKENNITWYLHHVKMWQQQKEQKKRTLNQALRVLLFISLVDFKLLQWDFTAILSANGMM